jgi:tRNA nucleotidyltransferase (CCA-adding enzyme)
MIPGSKKIEQTVLQKITPTQKERKEITQTIATLKKRVKQEIKKTNIPITLTLVGSTAKDTYIKTSVDIDLFLVFPTTTTRESLQEKGLTIGRAILSNQEECFAEHPYVRGTFQGVKTELVPCYKIQSASQKLSAVDRTPLHTTYIRNHLKETQKKEVRLFKQFLKGIGCYGAEAEIEGFSGYLCEILIIKYGTFQQLITAAQEWKYGEKIALTRKTIQNFEAPLIFIDPVDPERNVASALTKEKFEFFKTACTAYTKKPRLTFFFPNVVQPWQLTKIIDEIGTRHHVGIQLPKPDIIAENLYPQVRKAVRSISELCEQQGFPIVQSYFYINKNAVYIILQIQSDIISKTILHQGPPISLKRNADEFIEKWTNNQRTKTKPFEKNNRLYVEIEREYTDIQSLLHDQIKKLSLGRHIDIMMKKGFTVLKQHDLLTNELRLFWTQTLDARMPWER